MSSARTNLFEVIKSHGQYLVARKNLETEAVFQTKTGATAYIIFATQGSPDAHLSAEIIDDLIVRKKGKKFARLLNAAIRDELFEDPQWSDAIRDIVKSELIKLSSSYVVAELEGLTESEIAALSQLGVYCLITGHLGNIGLTMSSSNG